MESLGDWFFYPVFFSGFLGFLVAGLLIFVNRTDTFPSRLLAGFMACISFLAMNFALMTTSFFLKYPHFWRIFGWSSLWFPAFAYLYVRSVLRQEYRFRRTDIIWFIPGLIHFICLIPFYILPSEQKLAFLSQVAKDTRLIMQEPESLLPDGFATWLRPIVGVTATVGQVIMLLQWRKRRSQRHVEDSQNRKVFKWLVSFTALMVIFWVMIVVEFFLHFTTDRNVNYNVILTISGTILFISLILLVQPSILYGVRGWDDKSEKTESQSAEQPPALSPQASETGSKKQSISRDQGVMIKKQLEEHFAKNHPYRKKGYIMADLSKELDIPAYILSTFINQEYGKNFNELINEYRVNYLILETGNSDQYLQLTLEALGNHAGFNSRAAFIAAVKKVTGKNPSEVFIRK